MSRILLINNTLGPTFEHLREDFHTCGELREFLMRKAFEMGREVGNAKFAALLQQACAFGGSANANAAGVARIVGDVNQAAADETGDGAAQGRRFDLLSRRKISEGFR